MIWFMMDIKNKPLYIENRTTGDVYQMLDILKDPIDESKNLSYLSSSHTSVNGTGDEKDD